MKSFTVAAILASTAAALPASGTLPVPSCLPSGVVPSGVPLPSGLPTCLPSAIPGASALSDSGSAASFADVHNTVTVLQDSKRMLVELEPSVARQMSGLSLGSATTPLGEVTKLAPSVSDLSLDGLSTGYITVLTQDGQAALVQLSSTAASLFSTVGLTQVGTLVGGMVGTIEGASSAGLTSGGLTALAAGGLDSLTSGGLTKGLTGGLTSGGLTKGLTGGGLTKGLTGGLTSGGLTKGLTGGLTGGSLNNVMQITGLNGNILNMAVEPSLVTGLLSTLGVSSLSSLEAPVGSVLAQVPAGSDLLSQASTLGADPTKLMGVLSQDGASVLLVTVESAASGLLSTLGLSTLGSVAGSVVPV